MRINTNIRNLTNKSHIIECERFFIHFRALLIRFRGLLILFCASFTLNHTFKGVLFENLGEDRSVESACLIKTYSDMFQGESFDDMHVLFEINDYYLKKKYFVEFGLDKKLEDCLRNRTLIEYPTLYLVTAKDLSKYAIEEKCESLDSALAGTRIDEESSEPVEQAIEDDEIDEDVALESLSGKSESDLDDELVHKNDDTSRRQNGHEVQSKKVKTDHKGEAPVKKSEDYEIEEGEEIDSD